MDQLKKVASIAPLFIGFMMFFGFVRAYYYYDYWEIEITPYLELTEFLVLFLKDIHILAILIIIFSVQSLFSIELIERVSQIQLNEPTHETSVIAVEEDKDAKEKKEVFNETDQFHITDFLELVFETPNWLVVIILFIVTSALAIWFWFSCSILSFYISILFSFKLLYTFLRWIGVNDIRTLIDSLFFNFILVTIALVKMEIHHVTENASAQTYSIQLKNEDSLNSSDDFFFIGQTSNYIFFRDESNNSLRSVSMDEITSMTINSTR